MAGDIVLQKNVSSLIDVKALTGFLSWTAGGAADSATYTGNSIDRGGFSGGQLMPESMDVELEYSAQLASGKTLSVYLDLQHAPDNSAWADFATETTTVIATGPSGGGLVAGLVRMAVPNINAPSGAPGVDLTTANRYLRLLVVPHLSATVTDTAIITATGVFGGYDRLAAPNP